MWSCHRILQRPSSGLMPRILRVEETDQAKVHLRCVGDRPHVSHGGQHFVPGARQGRLQHGCEAPRNIDRASAA